MSDPHIRIIYDGDCPFCSAYVRIARLKENFQVELFDARTDRAIARECIENGHDLTEGMVVDIGGKVYYGADAINVISVLSSGSGFLNRLLAALFRNAAIARALYPMMKVGRRVALALLGRSPVIDPN